MSEAKKLILILGGARGGKSIFAEELAAELGQSVLFVATAEAHDEAMRARIRDHQRVRPAHWRTLEAPTRVAEALSVRSEGAEVVLLDCLTMLATNVLLAHPSEDPQADGTYEQVVEALRAELDALLAWHAASQAHLVVVTNEVGMGLVPPYPLGRAYRDLLGWANRRLALRADEVYLMVAGLPVEVKSLARGRAGKDLSPGPSPARGGERSTQSEGLAFSRRGERLNTNQVQGPPFPRREGGQGVRSLQSTGLIQVYTGDGKGKTTAALGLALRASGQGLRVGFVQFLKGYPRCGEHRFLERFPAFTIVQPAARSVFRQNAEGLRAAALEALAIAQRYLTGGEYDLLVLDEALSAFSLGALTLGEVMGLIDGKPAGLELVLTGRGAPPEVIAAADLVTEMVPHKHPYARGVKARKGIEY